jgi:TonB family protein
MSSKRREQTSVVPEWQALFAVFLTLALFVPAFSDERSYKEAFVGEVLYFAAHNRLNISRLHRDVHANCYIPVTVATTVLPDGSVKDISIVNSSSVPVVDRYIRFVIEQAAPYPPLASHYDPVPDEVTVTYEFRFDVNLKGEGLRSERPCERLPP